MTPGPYTKESVKKSYVQSVSLKEACTETGCPPYVAYIWLKKAGLLKGQEAALNGTSASRLGALAEIAFGKLVPGALPANSELEANCPSFDFDVYGITVDVKYASLDASTGAWRIRTAFRKPLKPDFYACFCASDNGKSFSEEMAQGVFDRGYRLFLIPDGVVGCQSYVYIKPKGSVLFEYELAPTALAKAFKEMRDDS